MPRLLTRQDEELVREVIAGDKAVFGELIERYQDKILRYLTRFLGDEDKAADVAQEAFIKAYVHLKSFDTGKKFSSWMYRIAHNEAVNYIKKHKKEISLEENSWIEETLPDDADVLEEAMSRQAQELAREYLEKLPVKYREVVTLYYINELSYEEISDVLRMPKATVGTQLRRGLKILKANYGK